MSLSGPEKESLELEAEYLAVTSLISTHLVESIAIGSRPSADSISEATGAPINVVENVLEDLYLSLPSDADRFTNEARNRESHEGIDGSRALPDVIEFLSPSQES